jgi:glutamyl-tRNA reductase
MQPALETTWTQLFAVGVTFRTAPAGVRDRLLVPPEAEAALYGALRAHGLAEATLLSTCDRVEVVGLAGDPGPAAERALAAVAARAGIDPRDLASLAVQHLGFDAVRHLFAIAAGLDSQVLGEPQVLGQVKDSQARAKALGAAGPRLANLFAAAFQAARRVRGETRLGEHPVSLAAAAVRVARTLHGELGDCRLLLLGLGEMGEILAGDFRDVGLGQVTVLHERPERAAAAAQRLGGRTRPWTELPAALAEAEVVVAARGAGELLLTPPLLRQALKARRFRPILVIDAALPADADPEIDRLDAAFRYTLADLERLASEGKTTREGSAVAAWRVLGEELLAFQRAQAERGGAEALVALRRHAEDLRREVLRGGRLDAEAATALLLKRLLHAPSEALRQAAAGGPAERAELEAALQRLFPLQSPPTRSDEEPS